MASPRLVAFCFLAGLARSQESRPTTLDARTLASRLRSAEATQTFATGRARHNLGHTLPWGWLQGLARFELDSATQVEDVTWTTPDAFVAAAQAAEERFARLHRGLLDALVASRALTANEARALELAPRAKVNDRRRDKIVPLPALDAEATTRSANPAAEPCPRR